LIRTRNRKTSLRSSQLKTENNKNCVDIKIEVDGEKIIETVELLEPLYANCNQTDRPENIVSCYPKVDAVVASLQALIEVMLPGKFSPNPEDTENLPAFLSSLLNYAWENFQPQMEKALPFRTVSTGSICSERKPEDLHSEALELTRKFFDQLPSIRKDLINDIKAAYNGDPAVLSYAEVKLASPGLMAIVSHRISHELYKLDVPLIPRIMSEWTHQETGIDIHPGARIGQGFFIDHGTGVVIGETSVIGKNVKLYQGVTIGAKSFPLDENGNPIKNIQRHPTLEDDVVVYSNASILGGDTVIGTGSTVAGNVFLMKSVPAGSLVANDAAEPVVKTAKTKK